MGPKRKAAAPSKDESPPKKSKAAATAAKGAKSAKAAAPTASADEEEEEEKPKAKKTAAKASSRAAPAASPAPAPAPEQHKRKTAAATSKSVPAPAVAPPSSSSKKAPSRASPASIKPASITAVVASPSASSSVGPRPTPIDVDESVDVSQSVMEQWFLTLQNTAVAIGPLFLTISMGCYVLGLWSDAFKQGLSAYFGGIGVAYLVMLLATLTLTALAGLPLIVTSRLWASVAYGHVLSWEVVMMVMLPVVASVVYVVAPAALTTLLK